MYQLARRSLFALAGLLLAASPAAATPFGSVELSLAAVNGSWTYWGGSVAGTESSPNQYAVADGSHAEGSYLVEWQGVSIDLDPGVSGNWSVTNTSATTQIMILSVIVPVLPVGPSSLMFGSTSVTVSDANFDGVGVLTNLTPSPAYTGLIDLGPVPASALLVNPYVLTAPPGGTASATQSFGVFPGSVPGPAVTSSIGIQHVFTLTAGDRATFNSTFFLVAVPEPGTLLLVISGLAGLGVFARRAGA